MASKLIDALDFETGPDGRERAYVCCPECGSENVEKEHDRETYRVRYLCECGETSEWG